MADICLALDTTGAACTAALVTPSHIIAQRSDDIGRGHAAHLAPLVDDIFKQARVSPREISRISVCTGPGSFTGQRVALAFARGLALPRNIPVLGFSALDVWAYQSDPQGDRNILTIADVRRNQLCWAYYQKGVSVRGPQTDDIETAERIFTTLTPDQIIRDDPISGSVLGWLGLDKTPENYPARALYSRPPDAKLPGGIMPPKSTLRV